MNILDAIHNKELFRPLFKDLSTWHAWEVFLRALFGLGIEDAKDRKLFRDCTGMAKPPSSPAREAYVICGRRSGKSFMTAIIAAFMAAFKNWKPYLSPGEKGWIFIIATDKPQAGIIKAYISGIFQRVPCLRSLIEKETVETLELNNGVNIAVKTSSFRTLRGYTVVCAILEELALWRSDESANPDREVLASVRPALATIPESRLIGISTPYSRSGILYQMWKDYFGQAGGPLIWKAATRVMNSTIDRRLIENALKEDPQAAVSEWESEFRSDIEAFISHELVESVTVPKRFELPRLEGVQYYAFADLSSGRQDSAVLALAHVEQGGKIVLDVLRERRPPFQPKGVIAEFADVLKSYGLQSVTADKYAVGFVTEAFTENGIVVTNSERTASELYLDALPLLTNGSVELLDNKRLAGQLAGLERRTRAGGKDLITHYPGGHDDVSNAMAGACVGAFNSTKAGPNIRSIFEPGELRPRPAFDSSGRINREF